MRNALLLATAFLLLACDDIAPTEQVDLCKGDEPPSNTCDQCKTPPFAKECPRCKHQPPEEGCENASNGGGGGATGGDGGHDGSGGTSGSGGNGGSSGMGGQGAGSGGSVAMMDGGPDGAVDGGHACSGCADGWNLCAGGECAQCLKDGDCGGTLHCDKLGTHACVQCVNDKHCEAQGMVCDEPKHTCVPCVVDSDCKDPAHPQCTNNVCGLCNDDDACEGRVGRTHCDKGTGSAMKGQCVQCLAHTDCKNPEPQCNSKRECEKCSGNDEACVDREGTEVCDTDGWSKSNGQCVQCTGTKYAACKVGSTEYVCDSLKRKCSTADNPHEKVGTGVCGECVSDAECSSGMKCVHMQFGEPAKDVGWFCQWEESGTGAGSPHGDCANSLPFVKTVPLSASEPKVSTIDHGTATICTLAVSTCPAYSGYKTADCDAASAPPAEPDDGLCGFDYSADPQRDDSDGRQDAYCKMFSSGSYLCTMRCSAPNDCPNNSCDTTAHQCNF